MQSLIQAHLPAVIVLCRVQAADKPPIVVSESHTPTHRHSQRSQALLQTSACTSKTSFSFFFSQNRLSKGFHGTPFTVCIGMSTPQICRPLTTHLMRRLRETKEEISSDDTKRLCKRLCLSVHLWTFIQSFVILAKRSQTIGAVLRDMKVGVLSVSGQ